MLIVPMALQRQAHSAVDDDFAADAVRRIVARQKQRRTRNFVRSAKALARRATFEVGTHGVYCLLRKTPAKTRRVDRPWAEGVHANAAFRQLGAQGADQRTQRRL